VRVKVAYLSPNLPPRIPRLEVSADGATLTAGAPGSAPPPLHQVLPSGVEVQYSVREQAAPSPEGPPAWANALRTATWEAVDPNDDPLTFRIEIRALGETTWQLLEKEFEGLAYTWNTASLPDGLYQLRVTASDRPGNPSGEERTAEKISAAFNVDHTPPEIVRLEVTGAGKGPLRLEATARDRGGCLLRASYALDGRDWRPVSPADGIFDEAEEVFSCVLPDADEGSRGLVFRVADESGNVTARRAAVSP